jgi:hypothetical protein
MQEAGILHGPTNRETEIAQATNCGSVREGERAGWNKSKTIDLVKE